MYIEKLAKLIYHGVLWGLALIVGLIWIGLAAANPAAAGALLIAAALAAYGIRGLRTSR